MPNRGHLSIKKCPFLKAEQLCFTFKTQKMLIICKKERKVAYRFSICLTLYFKTRLLQLKSTNWLQDSSSKKIIYIESKIFSNLMDFLGENPN